MEETIICIIGGGPVGTLLSALLSRNYGIPNIVLERDTSIPTDPRAFSLLENGVRCLQAIGLYDEIFREIGHHRSRVLFVSGRHHDLNATPFFELKFGDIGYTAHPQNLMFDQPNMERCMRKVIQGSSIAQFRDGSEVNAIDDKGDSAEVTYIDHGTGTSRQLRARLVIGTDGKGGFTRKRYLEPRGIELKHTYPYEETFAGGNLNVRIPTPESHPKFPLWTKGYTPEDVLQYFVPEEFRFMSNPDRQAVLCRFGANKKADTVHWRFEFRVLPGEDADVLSRPEEVRRVLWPYMVHQGSKYGLREDVEFPPDCMEIRRTWKYKFEARTCTKFHLGRVIVAGDAAHVFPPFGGLGITTGFLDVMGLSWRLAVIFDPRNASKDPTPMLDAWETERRFQIKQATDNTMERGAMFTETNPIKISVRDWMFWTLQRTPVIKGILDASGKEPARYEYSEGMSFWPKLQGGVSFSQLCVREMDGTFTLSDDKIFSLKKKSLFQLVVLASNTKDVKEAAKDLRQLKVAGDMVREASYVIQDVHVEAADSGLDGLSVARIANADEFYNSPLLEGRPPLHGYKPGLWKSHYAGKRYIVIRPDRFVFAACKNLEELSMALESVERILDGGSR